MKTTTNTSTIPFLRCTAALCLGLTGALTSLAQTFDSGSDGSFGDLVVTNDTVLPMPPDGIFKCKTIHIAQGKTLSFGHNAANTPVFLLAAGDVELDGNINLDGGIGGAAGGLSGPGGFDGGHPGFGSVLPGAGLGPGGGRGGINDDGTSKNVAGGGGYLFQSGAGTSTNHGRPYGTPVLIPIVGGSGGGGTIGKNGEVGGGGGGGGGAILIASNTKIVIGDSGTISAYGGHRTGAPNGGSGGAIRIVAPLIVGVVKAYVNAESDVASPGRVRIDTIDATQMGLDLRPAASGSRGSFLLTGLSTNAPQLNILQVATQSIPPGQIAPVSVLLPNGTSPDQAVIVQAKNFGTKVPVNVVLTPESGDPVVFPADIDNTTKNPATATINVTIPINVPVRLNVWTR